MKSDDQKKLEALIVKELGNCTEDVYPALCKIKDSSMGVGKIQRMAIKVIADSGMSVQSALAQLDSSL